MALNEMTVASITTLVEILMLTAGSPISSNNANSFPTRDMAIAMAPMTVMLAGCESKSRQVSWGYQKALNKNVPCIITPRAACRQISHTTEGKKPLKSPREYQSTAKPILLKPVAARALGMFAIVGLSFISMVVYSARAVLCVYDGVHT